MLTEWTVTPSSCRRRFPSPRRPLLAPCPSRVPVCVPGLLTSLRGPGWALTSVSDQHADCSRAGRFPAESLFPVGTVLREREVPVSLDSPLVPGLSRCIVFCRHGSWCCRTFLSLSPVPWGGNVLVSLHIPRPPPGNTQLWSHLLSPSVLEWSRMILVRPHRLTAEGPGAQGQGGVAQGHGAGRARGPALTRLPASTLPP